MATFTQMKMKKAFLSFKKRVIQFMENSLPEKEIPHKISHKR